ncbi:MAG: threonine synthase [Acidimicrobiia bacterium]
MYYVSTRGASPAVDFEAALLAGPAPDGGLYVPEHWPVLPPPEELAGLRYPEVVAEVMAPFVDGSLAPGTLLALAEDAYRDFRHPEVAPLRALGENVWLLELFWGPTLSFKDYALQLLGRLFDHVLARRGRRMLVLGATSGDTGPAAMEALQGREGIEAVILYPHLRISDIQRRQMTTIEAPNVHAVAVEGTFDDCQGLVKALFADPALRGELRLGAVNSINWVRVAAQAAFYVWALLRLGEPATFSVPTGNFGNVLAADVARRMGAPVERLIVATNANRGLVGLPETGVLRVGPVEPTVAPAMDIQAPSNLERLLFEVSGRDGAAVASSMGTLAADGRLAVPEDQLGELRRVFEGGWRSDREVEEEIARAKAQHGLVIDPHTAIGLSVGRERQPEGFPLVAVATAHPAKFPEAVERATGMRPYLPTALGDLPERPERLTVLPADPRAVAGFLRKAARRG